MRTFISALSLNLNNNLVAFVIYTSISDLFHIFLLPRCCYLSYKFICFRVRVHRWVCVVDGARKLRKRCNNRKMSNRKLAFLLWATQLAIKFPEFWLLCNAKLAKWLKSIASEERFSFFAQFHWCRHWLLCIHDAVAQKIIIAHKRFMYAFSVLTFIQIQPLKFCCSANNWKRVQSVSVIWICIDSCISISFHCFSLRLSAAAILLLRSLCLHSFSKPISCAA